MAKNVVIRSTPWEWLIALIVLQVADLVSTRIATADAIMIEGNPLLAPIINTWWILVAKLAAVGVGVWLMLRAPRILKAVTLVYFGIILSNIVMAISLI